MAKSATREKKSAGVKTLLEHPERTLFPEALAAPEAAENAGLASVPDADRALKELGDLDRLEAGFKQQLDWAVNSARKQHASKLFLSDRPGVSFEDRRRELLGQLEAFFLQHKPALLVDDKKSVELNHGTLGTRQQPARLDPFPPAAGSAGSRNMLERLVKFVVERILEFKLFAKVPTSTVVKASVTLDKIAILKAYQSGQITQAELSKAGFAFVEPADSFFAKPAEQHLSSQSTQTLTP